MQACHVLLLYMATPPARSAHTHAVGIHGLLVHQPRGVLLLLRYQVKDKDACKELQSRMQQMLDEVPGMHIVVCSREVLDLGKGNAASGSL